MFFFRLRPEKNLHVNFGKTTEISYLCPFFHYRAHIMRRKILLLLTVCLLTIYNSFAVVGGLAEGTSRKPGKPKTAKDTSSVRKGWTFGLLPSVAFDADKGFQGGLLTNIYYFGDGSAYPEYLHSLYFEAAYTTKRSGIFRFSYDSKYLIPGHRFKFDISYLPDAMNDFYGYNGYQTVYSPARADKKRPEGYVSRAFYKTKRNLFRLAADIDGKIGGNWYWNAGIGLLGYDVDTVNLTMLNKGKDNDSRLPDVDGLYDKFVKWGIIPENEADGSWQPYLRAGLSYDSRDKEQNTNRGIYTDAFLTYNAAFGEDRDFNNLMLNASFRHFVPVYKDNIIFAYRLATQLTVAGESPFYLNGHYNSLFLQRVLYEGLGGGNTLRGIRRNRLTAKGYAFANVEFRFKVADFKIKKEFFQVGLNPFLDAGMVLQPYRIDENRIRESIAANDPDFDPDLLSGYLLFGKAAQVFRPHLSAGLGLKLMMNENFVLSVDWAMPFDRRDNDNKANFYIKMGYMF